MSLARDALKNGLPTIGTLIAGWAAGKGSLARTILFGSLGWTSGWLVSKLMFWVGESGSPSLPRQNAPLPDDGGEVSGINVIDLDEERERAKQEMIRRKRGTPSKETAIVPVDENKDREKDPRASRKVGVMGMKGAGKVQLGITRR